jgi:hypothetical protein
LNESKERNDNSALIAINRAHIQSLCFNNARDIINTFLASERIYDDLTLAAEFASHKNSSGGSGSKDSSLQHQWDQQFVLRSWHDIPIQHEVRAFIYNDTLTCMCQYYHVSVPLSQSY